jgi:hypothetical protein
MGPITDLILVDIYPKVLSQSGKQSVQKLKLILAFKGSSRHAANFFNKSKI